MDFGLNITPHPKEHPNGKTGEKIDEKLASNSFTDICAQKH